MTDAAPILEVRDLTVSLPGGLDRANAVEGLSFDVRPQQIVCLVGESGSGKSVTAAAVMHLLPRRVLRVTGGSMRLEGQDLTRIGQDEICRLRGNRMAMVFQEPLTALNPVTRIGNQIAEVLRIHRPEMPSAEVEARVLALMEDVRLPDPAALRMVYPHQISGGQRQRVMIAMALALEPALIIADEPTTALDVTTQAQILRLFRELLTRHHSGVLLITHDFGVVADVADEVIVMQHGRMVEKGPPERVLSRPEHPYTRSLIDAVPRFRFRQPVAAAATPALTVRDLSLTYRSRSFTGRKRETRALDGVSFTIDPGETLGIVGESGSGKTTLAKCLLRFETPDHGQMLFGDRDLATAGRRDLRGFRRRIQMVFQDPYKSLNPRRHVGQSLVEGPVHHGVARDRATARAVELLELVGLRGDAMSRFPHEFSGGQRQRICIARALAMEPEIIVADEPVSALDVSVQAQVLELFEELRRKLGFSMLFITHDLRIASNICDRVGVMHRGRLVEMGRTEQIFRDPQHAYTRELLAAVPGGVLTSAS
ncbi:peptide/nickel transport system ATP-binding protein [Stella humosa]|uniref:Peptide/nickel transport system ATP-binding protein n=1 Tax=Stella humosa TaxID=94 RepID=A0A3N1KY49_9PROT|nr:ABC transporter ATP-binding protein [Stella humosa]ROP83709.1 peptide/nickel transport system ATP-binding protein [Stella humosa]BBK33019.1 ABC transporter ATP-binding protein [Stella humosa]